MDVFLCLDAPFNTGTENLLAKQACALYALYTVHNCSRHSPLPPPQAREALTQRLREATRGHAHACAHVSSAGGH